MKMQQQQQLNEAYYNIKKPTGYAGAAKLVSEFPKQNVREWLATQSTYTLHKPMRRKFPTHKYRVSGTYMLWQIDLLEMIPYAKINQGFRYILTCIDVYSRFARALPLKTKDGVTVANALNKMLQKAPTTPKHIQSDLGKEFYNVHVQNLFKRFKINHYTVHSQFKAALVERFNRTLREKLTRYFTHRGRKVWIHVLPQIIETYNRTPHSGIAGKRPVELEDVELGDIDFWKLQEGLQPRKLTKTRRAPHKVGTLVRISRISANPFRKNFDQNWSEEVYRIHAIDRTERPVMYTLKDIRGEFVQGRFYHEELQSIGEEMPTSYRIERIIRTRGKGKDKQYLVKWFGYDNSHNSWISQDNFIKNE